MYGLDKEEYQSDEIQLLTEALANYYAKYPALAFRASWAAYVNNLLSLNDAACAVGATIYQYLELGRNYTQKTKVNVPKSLLDRANQDETFLLGCLPERMIRLMEQLLTQDILLPMVERYSSSMWEDLRLLKALHLVKEYRRERLYHYRLNLTGH